MGLNFCFVLMIVLRIVLELKIKEKITKTTRADAGITLILLVGMIYEAIIAEDFNQFLEAETFPADILRTFKFFKLFLLFSERKYYWKKLHDLGKALGKTVFRILSTFFLWFIIILGFTIMGYHIEGGRMLVNEDGEVDMDGGRPNRFNFNDIYHSLIFILLDSVDEDWDCLMFKEYMASIQ